jgi:hypothetical protein
MSKATHPNTPTAAPPIAAPILSDDPEAALIAAEAEIARRYEWLKEHRATLRPQDQREDYLRFNERFRRIAKRAGLDAQARDFRRTAMVRMAEAGASVPEIAAVSGHTIDRTTRILETYLPRTLKLAEGAITKLAEHKSGPKV